MCPYDKPEVGEVQTASKARAVFFNYKQFTWKAQIQASRLAALEKSAQLQVNPSWWEFQRQN